jgi:hypothetical protein
MIVFWLCASLVSAQTWGTVPVQGLLTDGSGAAVNGSRAVTFRLFNDSEAGSEAWSDALTVPFVDGAFSAWLGSGARPLDVAAFAEDLWLEVELAGGPPSARVAIGWAPRAGVAASALRFGGQTWDEFALPWSRITGSPFPASCAPGEVPAWDDAAGAWSCGARDALGAGNGIHLDGGEISLDTEAFWNLSRLDCDDGQIPSWDAVGGAWGCVDRAVPISPGAGLMLDPESGDLTLDAAPFDSTDLA